MGMMSVTGKMDVEDWKVSGSGVNKIGYTIGEIHG
jgi:hypothetical protein